MEQLMAMTVGMFYFFRLFLILSFGYAEWLTGLSGIEMLPKTTLINVNSYQLLTIASTNFIYPTLNGSL